MGGGGKLTGFELAGADGRYHRAQAKIVPSTGSGQAGETVVVTAAKVARGVSVRYAWSPVPTWNLINKAPLPAWPFQCTLDP